MLRSLWLCLSLLFIVSCGGESDSPPTSPQKKITLLEVTATSSNILSGNTVQLSAMASYSDGTNANVASSTLWTSSDTSIATVNNAGKVTGISEGVVSITGIFENKNDAIDITVPVMSDVSFSNKENTLVARWKSSFDDELGYAIQRKESSVLQNSATNEQWNTVKEHGPITEGFYVEQEIENQSGTYRIVAKLQNDDAVILASPSATTDFNYDKSISDEISILPPSEESPYKGTVTFTLSQPTESAQWFIDSKNACGNSQCTNQTIALNTSRYTDGSHRLDATAEISDDVFVYLDEVIEIYNPNLTLSVSLHHQDDNTLIILPTAASKSDIDSVQYFIDDELVATQLNKTPITIADKTYDYHYKWTKVYGEHSIKVVVSDDDGEYQENSQSITINNAPTITIASPLNQELITSDTLVVVGTVSNENEEVVTTVSFGDIQIGRKEGTGDFRYEYSLAGLPEQNYLIAVSSEDEFNKRYNAQVQFQYAPSLSNGELIYTIPDGYNIVEINDNQLLMENSSFGYLIQNLDTPNIDPDAIQFNRESMTYMHHPHVNNQGDFASDYGPAGSLNMYLKKKGQALINLTDLINEGNGYGYHSSFINNTLVQLPSDGRRFYIWDTSTVSYEQLLPPVNTGRWLNWKFTHNEEWLCQSAPIDVTYDVYLYQFNSGMTPKRLTFNSNQGGNLGYGSFCTGNDSRYVAYTTSPKGEESKSSLYLYDMINNTTESISADVRGTGSSTSGSFVDGVLAWSDTDKVVHILDVYNRNLKQIDDASLQKVRFGKVTYSTNDGLYVWDGVSEQKVWNSSKTHFISQDGVYIVSDKLVYFAKL